MGRTLAIILLSFGLLTAAVEDDIRQVLDKQVAAWNRGDLRAFMEGYEDSASTTFAGTTITKGHAQVLANYLKRYPGKENMGALRFSDLEIHPLNDEYTSVIGRWHLTRTRAAGGDTGGIFTLLFRKTAHGWKIILDHTS